jgi:hypothetical protein
VTESSPANPSPFRGVGAIVKTHRVGTSVDGSRRHAVKKVLAIVLIAGFLMVDFLFFHDILKPGEVVTFPQFLTGLLSIPVMVVSVLHLAGGAPASRDAG